MGAAMEEARRLLYEKAIKKFTMEEVTRQHKMSYKNLIEMISKYPGNGEGFKVWSKWWQPGQFFHVKDVQLFSGRYGRLQGVYYENNQPVGGKVEHIRGALKRGVWNYQLNDPAFTKPEVQLDNGLRMNIVEMQEMIDEKKAFLAERKKMIEWIKPPEPKVKEAKGKKGVKGKVPPKKK